MAGLTADVIIIGAGIVGCSTAYELARAGWSALVLDRTRGPGQGSTSASSAVVRFNYSTLTGIIAAWESKHRWEEWEDHLGGTDDGALARFHRTGGLCLDSPDHPSGAVLTLFEHVGVPFEVWSPDQVRQRLPFLETGRHHPPTPVTDDAFWDEPTGSIGGYWTPDAGFVDDPAFAAHNLMAAAKRHGARFRFGATVTQVRREGGRIRGVALGDGSELHAPVLVNAAGPHSGRVNELAGALEDFRITTRPLRQEVHEVPGVASRPPLPLVADLDLGTYFRGTPAGNILVGGTEPACDPLVWLDDPDEVRRTPTRQVYEAQAYRLARRVPEATVPPTPRGVVGVYDVSTDWVPIYDRTSVDGYYVAIGTSGNQFKNAPVIGEFMATLIRAVENGHDHDASPVTVPLSRTGHVADLGHYSRLRSPAATARNVMG